MPNPCVCRLIIEGNEVNRQKFIEKFDGKQFADFIIEDNSKVTICDFVSAYTPPIKHIKNILLNLEKDNELKFQIKITIIYYETGYGFYGKFTHKTRKSKKHFKYTIQEDDLVETDANNMPVVLDVNGEYLEDNYPANQIAGGKFLNLLLAYGMDTYIAHLM